MQTIYLFNFSNSPPRKISEIDDFVIGHISDAKCLQNIVYGAISGAQSLDVAATFFG